MITKDIIVPAAWDEVLRIVQEQYPDAILAGGALRDLDCARTPKDLDIFVSQPKQETVVSNDQFDFRVYEVADVRSFKSVVIPGYTVDTQDKFEDSHDCDNSLLGTEVHVKDGFLPVNIVYLSHDCTPQERFARFDFGLNKIGYDGKRVFASMEYSHDKNNHCFTLRRAENIEQIDRSMDRAVKFQERYSGWDLIIPSKNIEIVVNSLRAADTKREIERLNKQSKAPSPVEFF